MEQARNVLFYLVENAILMAIIRGAIVILITTLVLSVGNAIITKYFKINIKRKKNINKVKTIEKIARNIFKAAIVFIGTAIFLSDVLGVDISSILTIAGVSGIAVGFASQTIIKDFLTGVMLLMEDTITIGDIVEMNGYKGMVEDISLRSICLRDDNDVLHIIPNNIIRNFSNYSRPRQTDSL